MNNNEAIATIAKGARVTWTRSTNEGVRNNSGIVERLTAAEALVHIDNSDEREYVMIDDLEVIEPPYELTLVKYVHADGTKGSVLIDAKYRADHASAIAVVSALLLDDDDCDPNFRITAIV